VGVAGTWPGDPLGALLLAGCDPYAELTMVDGVVLVRAGRLVLADEAAIVERARAATLGLVDRSGEARRNPELWPDGLRAEAA
jgi:hypothetical protein